MPPRRWVKWPPSVRGPGGLPPGSSRGPSCRASSFEARYSSPAMPKGKPREREQSDTAVVTERKSKTQKPKLWKVILHNDDFTTMEFVIHVLEVVFSREPAEAQELMLQVHTRGMCVAGVYTHEIAETKVGTVEQMARAAEFPFLSAMEPE